MELTKYIQTVSFQPLTSEVLSKQQVKVLWQRAHKHTVDNENKGFRKDMFGEWVGDKFYNETTNQFGWQAVLFYTIRNDIKTFKIHPVNSCFLQKIPTNFDENGWNHWNSFGVAADAFDGMISVVAGLFTPPE